MYRQSLFFLAILFFMMGLITCLNDILVPYFKEIFQLDYSRAALVQFSFFGAYGLASIPASLFIERYGYQRGMIQGFLLASAGCLLFFPAVLFHTYSLFLAALFVLATGIVMLQVAGNPFVSLLGPPQGASSRLSMVQAFNSFGTFIAPLFGSYFILTKLSPQQTQADGLRYPYMILAVLLLVLALVLSRSRFPPLPFQQKPHHNGSWREAFKHKRLFLGMLAIFSYVGAEVAIGSFMVNYVMERMKMEETQAATMVAIYWGGAMAGRFMGIFTLKEFRPGKVLLIHALLAISLILISINSYGLRSVYSIVLVGVCNSIMFPTIFSLSIRDLDDHLVQKGSGLLSTAIIGGAFTPYLMGLVADAVGLRVAFLFPIFTFPGVVGTTSAENF